MKPWQESQYGNNLGELTRKLRMRRDPEPFPYIRADNVFLPTFYEALDISFTALLRHQGKLSKREGFRKTIKTYDALIAAIPSDSNDPLRIFVSRSWHDLLSSLFCLQTTGDVKAELHHHQCGSSSGQIHNDFNPGWFVSKDANHEINESDKKKCSYRYGESKLPNTKPRRVIRALTMIYYLGNEAWKQGDGGETGLYSKRRGSVEKPDIAIPPINNSMICFECSPHSYHSFISNPRADRNAVVLWLHGSYEDAAERWGENAIVQWPLRES
jgi:hypothetical protein